MSRLPEHAKAAIEAERLVIIAANKVRNTGGDEATCIEYDRVCEAENVAYEAMNDIGLTAAQWSAFDKAKAVQRRAIEF